MHLRSLIVAVLSCAVVPSHSLLAQLQPPSTGGIVALHQELRMLGHTQRVLMIGAHPDDEDTELLTLLVRGEGAESAYLSLNRGEGGQNLIGAELGEALGLLRTEELLAARRLDGAQQFFTRAYDFGFSKTLDDTWAHWPRDSILKDVVRIVRRFRPQVVVSIFSGTPRDGHGQHQAAGWAAQEAFRVAGDPARFPELEREEGLAPWTPLRLYRSARFDTAATTLAVDGGAIDPAVGKSYHQTAMQGRSLHRSQDMGQLQRIGPSPVRLALWQDRTGGGAASLFAGLDTTLAASAADTARSAEWRSIGGDLSRADALGAPALVKLRQRFVAAAGGTSRLTPAQRDQLMHLDAALENLRGIVCDAVADDDRVVPGQMLRITTTCSGSPSAAPELIYRGTTLDGRSTDAFAVPDTAVLSRPYFLADPKHGDLYSWRDVAPQSRGLPREAPTLALRYDGVVTEVAFRYNDQAVGERRKPVTIVPRVDVKIDPDTALWSTASRGIRHFRVTVTHGARDTTSGRVRLEVPAGWAAPAPQAFRFAHEDETAAFDFQLRTPDPLAAMTYEVRAIAEDSRGHRYDGGVYTIDYPHIRARSYTAAAAARIVAAPLALPSLSRVGYVRGAADRVPESLIGAGVAVELLDPSALARGDLSRYDVIVVGPRAYETDTALIAHNGRLLDYARAGGMVLVQYQQYQFIRGGFAPLPMTIASPHDRVTDENAPVRALDPNSAALQRPNALNDSDWRGWVQERALYMAHTWDPAYRPVLEMHDPGEAAQDGGLLVASIGKGTYVYTGLAFFRELPAGVPGAYRLFANLLALSRRPSP